MILQTRAKPKFSLLLLAGDKPYHMEMECRMDRQRAVTT